MDSDDEIITVVGADRYTEHQRQLESHGIDVTKAVTEGRLHVITADDWYMKGGSFSAGRMYALVQQALADLQRKGRRARGAGAMEWALQGAVDTRELMEYEARENFLIAKYDATLLCVYDLNEISGRMLMDILVTHPYIIHGRALRKNPYYVPAIERLREVLTPDGPSHAAGPH